MIVDTNVLLYAVDSAAICHHGAGICSFDSDLTRFPELAWTNPAAG